MRTFHYRYIYQLLIGCCYQANVLVDQNGVTWLADFGLATVRYNGATLSSVLEGRSTRWTAREVIVPPDIQDHANDPEEDVSDLKFTCFSDVWSFAMLALE